MTMDIKVTKQYTDDIIISPQFATDNPDPGIGSMSDYGWYSGGGDLIEGFGEGKTRPRG